MESSWVCCGVCGLPIAVSPGARTIWCSRCRLTNYLLPPTDTIGRVQEQVLYGLDWIKGFLSNVSGTAINYAAANPSLNNKPPLTVVMNYSGGYYSPPPPPPLPAPASCPYPAVAGGKKRALLCGVSYKSRRYELKGSINDVNCMRYFLVQKLGFPNESVFVLTEEEPHPDHIPTKRNIQKALQWLIRDCKSGDSLVFHYSGHGSQKLNLTGDEIDGYDETLCPLDYQTEGMILDDEINATIVRPLPTGAILHAIIDACHSGTVLDLPFVCKINRNGSHWWQDQSCPSGVYKGTSGGLALCFSACDDHQTSADTDAFSSGTIMQGAMTYSFIRAVENTPGLTYGHLLTSMRSAIRDVNTGLRFNGPIAFLIKKVFRRRLSKQVFAFSLFEPWFTQQEDLDGDEIDGYDKTLCPLDYQTQGLILDDEINATIVRPLPKGATLHAMIDACHSGTNLDLSFLCKIKS
ncbi:metacaspase-1-like [Telopea speciosissima]|uniref:metacaspase-1-like n=1 Tax=Telopea speciosissima TaxID=54955 RepID=UPI001CC569AC|nr:metacaspase-1-like [Telopea speciosissima]